jgi:two-component system nitrogen regulation sensor histidine kinase GlnL
MSSPVRAPRDDTSAAAQIPAALPLPLLSVGPKGDILFANPACEQFFGTSAAQLLKQKLADIVPFASPLMALVAQARLREAPASERNVDLSMPRHGERIADATVTPLPEPEGAVAIILHERGLQQRIDRQMQTRTASRSVHGMAAVLAHEIKNPLAGIRGAAQLLEDVVPDSDKNLTQLICDEADRIRALIDRMESFGDTRALTPEAVNIHEVLDRVCKVAQASFARDVVITEQFDPSLPPVLGSHDQLIQVFLNLVRNAADAVPERGGEIVLSTAYRHGMHMRAANERVSLPLEVTVRDNGAGIPADLMPHIFDPFVTTKRGGSGLGLALAAKIVADHGGVIECESVSGRTLFRVLLPRAEGG